MFATQGLADLQVAARGGVQTQVFGIVLDAQAQYVSESRSLSHAAVFEQGARSAECRYQAFHAEARQILRAELFAERSYRAVRVELPSRQALQRYAEASGQAILHVVGQQDLGRL